ncbi:MAG: hypothetical protein ABSH33_23135 [Steroidobacteraceae bacterium]
MKTPTAVSGPPVMSGAVPPMGACHTTIAIYPNFTDVGDALLVLDREGFTSDRITLLGREQERRLEKFGHEWGTLKITKNALEGAALGAIPGLVLITGIALTGGIGMVVGGPMVAGISALGMGALVGSVMGGASTGLDNAGRMFNVNAEEEVADAVSHGHWVIVVHCDTEAEAHRARALLPNRRIARDSESGTMAPSHLAAARVDIEKLATVVGEALEAMAADSNLPGQVLMCNIDAIDVRALKASAHAAVKKIATATNLHTAQITEIFKANRVASVNDIVNRLHEQSSLNRAPW